MPRGVYERRPRQPRKRIVIPEIDYDELERMQRGYTITALEHRIKLLTEQKRELERKLYEIRHASESV